MEFSGKENHDGFYDDAFSTMWIEEGIGFQVYKPNVTITLDVAKNMVKKRVESFNGVARPVLVDVRNLGHIQWPAKKYFASREASRLITAGAVLTDNTFVKVIVNLFLRNVGHFPAKAFSDRDEALQWLRFKRDSQN